MKTKAELNENILKITTVIYSEYPELIKYLNEMPITIPVDNSPEINITILEDYLNSLLEIVRNYNLSNHKM